MAHLTRLLWAACVVALVVQPGYAQTTRYAGRPLADVLIELRAAGVNVVFSSELVRPEMRVQAEPRSEDPRRMLNELLKPHGLIVRELARGRLTIVRQRPPATSPAAEVVPVGTIAGRVIDSRSGAPLSGGQVQIESTGQHDLSVGDGRFEITAVPVGSQRVLVSLVGYALVRRDVDVSASKTTELVVALAEGAGTYEETVTVTASSDREGEVGVARQAVLGSRDLQALRGVLADDPMRAVQTLPGVTTGDDARAESSPCAAMAPTTSGCPSMASTAGCSFTPCAARTIPDRSASSTATSSSRSQWWRARARSECMEASERLSTSSRATARATACVFAGC